MLAANLKSPFDNGLFTLALALVSKKEPNIPASLVDYFNEILQQIRCVVTQPGQIIQGIHPEALDLALELEPESCLYKELIALDNYNSLTPDKAEHLLHDLEALSVS